MVSPEKCRGGVGPRSLGTSLRQRRSHTKPRGWHSDHPPEHRPRDRRGARSPLARRPAASRRAPRRTSPARCARTRSPRAGSRRRCRGTERRARARDGSRAARRPCCDTGSRARTTGRRTRRRARPSRSSRWRPTRGAARDRASRRREQSAPGIAWCALTVGVAVADQADRDDRRPIEPIEAIEPFEAIAGDGAPPGRDRSRQVGDRGHPRAIGPLPVAEGVEQDRVDSGAPRTHHVGEEHVADVNRPIRCGIASTRARA